jgi:putative transposase
LVLEGHPLPAHCRKPKQNRIPAGSIVGTVGIDLGPSTIAVVGDEMASLERFCPELTDNQPKIRRLQRKMDRSKRRSNPNNYKKDGQIKPGRKTWTFSKTYLKDRATLADLKHREKAHRKNLHGRKVNSLLQLGNVVKFEKLSYKAWQKRFGKSVGKNAPGLFISTLKRKAASAGVSVVEVNPVATYLSSRCVCGLRQKKRLSERTHRCSRCGIEMQRDLFSAFLVKHVNSKNQLHAEVEQFYEGAKRLLGCAWNTAKTANRRSVNASVVSKARRQSGLSRKVRRSVKNMDVVTSSNAGESHKEADASLSKPPAFRRGVV